MNPFSSPDQIARNPTLAVLGFRRQLMYHLHFWAFVAIAPLILVPALILITPISGIPGLPTLGAVLMILVTVQKLMGRNHLWLPGWLTRRNVAGERLRNSVDWLRTPARWVSLPAALILGPI